MPNHVHCTLHSKVLCDCSYTHKRYVLGAFTDVYSSCTDVETKVRTLERTSKALKADKSQLQEDLSALREQLSAREKEMRELRGSYREIQDDLNKLSDKYVQMCTCAWKALPRMSSIVGICMYTVLHNRFVKLKASSLVLKCMAPHL